MENVHSGHRKRVRERAEKEGLAAFAPHEVLELLLMRTIPMRDVNPIAHRLIERFGSVRGTLLADRAELESVEGVGTRTVEFLLAAGALAEEYACTGHTPGRALTNLAETQTYVLREMAKQPGSFHAVLLDTARNVTHTAEIPCAKGMLLPKSADVVREALAGHAASVLTVRVAGEDGARVTREELELTSRLAELFAMLEIGYPDHIVVPLGGEDVFSLRDAGFL